MLTLYLKILLKYFIYLSLVILNKVHKRETARVLMINMGISKPHPRAYVPSNPCSTLYQVQKQVNH